MIEHVLTALEVFARTPDKASIEQANSWLQGFQHSVEAWSACRDFLLNSDVPPAAKLFAAQTFRTKVTYDLHQLGHSDLLPLRNTLILALEKYKVGPRTIITQLCLAISGLALQDPEWRDVIDTMNVTFGNAPTVLLEFLKVLPEELTGNTKLPLTDDDYRAGCSRILSEHAKDVVNSLSDYNRQPGVSSDIKQQIFNCLRAWIVAGEVTVEHLSKTSLFEDIFAALASDQLFDSAVDVVCDTIHETQETADNMAVITLIRKQLNALVPRLYKDKDDSDKIRGLTRIFAEAGESYCLLIVRDPEFYPILEAICICSAYKDLDIVPITFPFWMLLAQTISKQQSVNPSLPSAYQHVMSAIIEHLHFPSDEAHFTDQEADNFRSFRHVMGDTLKDCCLVLGADACLLKAYDLVVAALHSPPQVVSWQAVEAPLFAMRSMGAEVDPSDDTVVPKIMHLIQQLPNHPKIRYAALLIIGRYTEWLGRHPTYIPSQLKYIEEGLQDSDGQVNAAACQALKYLCQDCKQHLVDLLPNFKRFLETMGTKLAQEDKLQVYEGVAHVISAMPMGKAAEALQDFSRDILAIIHAATQKTTGLTSQELKEIGNGLENLDAMLHVVGTFGDHLPPKCQNSCEEAWLIFDNFIGTCVRDNNTAELTARVLRCGLALFGQSAISVAQPMVSRMTSSFEYTGYPSFLWISGKIVGSFGKNPDPALQSAFEQLFLRSTSHVATMLQSMQPREVPDVLEDYVQLLIQLVREVPTVFFKSPAFPVAFQVSIAALTLVSHDALLAALDLFCRILTVLEEAAVPIGIAIEKDGPQLVGYLLYGMTGDFPEDSTSDVVTIFCSLAKFLPSQLLSWLPPVLEGLPLASVSGDTKTKLRGDMTAAIIGDHGRVREKVKHAIMGFARECRRARGRRRGTPLDD